MSGIVVIVSLLFSASVTRAAGPNGSGASAVSGPEVTAAIQHDVSPPLRSIGSNGAQSEIPRDRPLHLLPTNGSNSGSPDTALQATPGPAVATSSGLKFAGVGQGDYGFTPNAAPPDTNGAVGATQYVQWVNESFAVFNKSTGSLVYGPVAGNSLWKGFGGGCEVNNDGDPIAQYDKAAQRWILTQFSVSSASTYGYLQCVAVSTTSDATGTYNRYAFSYGGTQFNDYPKLGVWPDAYYTTYNIFNNGSTFAGAKLCAMDRNAMLSGAAATQQCFQLSTSYGGVLPADLDGTTAPPAGSPNYLVNFGSNSLNLWKFHVDWANSANTTLTGPTNIPVAGFSAACNGGTCIPQSGTSQQLDSLADRLMYRLAYRNFGDHESLVVNHSVTAGSSVGVRWYELQNSPGSTMATAAPIVHQQGTYAPDSSYRWMGSIAMDHSGDIAMGYSVSSSTMHPSIAYTGRVPSDTLGTMETESSILTGGGSQGTLFSKLSRWGDYSAMTVDPSDDCTFWYTTEYLKSNGTFNWSTEIASFKFPSCSATTTNDFSMSATPSSLSLAPGASGSSTIGTAVTSGSAQSVSLSVSGLPSGATASFNPTSVTAGGSSTMTITAGATTSAGTYTVTVTGTGSSATHTTTISLTVTGTTTNDFSMSASPSSVTIAQGSSSTSTINTAVTSGSAQSVNLSVTGLPSGATATFSPNPVNSGSASTMTISVGSTTVTGTYTATVTGAGTNATHTITISLTVTASNADFSISASPTNARVPQSGSTSYTVTVSPTNGFNSSVALSVGGLPGNTTSSFNPTSIASGSGTSTLTITTSGAPKGNYTLTITGAGGGLTHAATVTLGVSRH
jgi:hypothetical protein